MWLLLPPLPAGFPRRRRAHVPAGFPRADGRRSRPAKPSPACSPDGGSKPKRSLVAGLCRRPVLGGTTRGRDTWQITRPTCGQKARTLPLHIMVAVPTVRRGINFIPLAPTNRKGQGFVGSIGMRPWADVYKNSWTKRLVISPSNTRVRFSSPTCPLRRLLPADLITPPPHPSLTLPAIPTHGFVSHRRRCPRRPPPLPFPPRLLPSPTPGTFS